MFKETHNAPDWQIVSEVPTGRWIQNFLPQLNVKYSLQFPDYLSSDYFSAEEYYIGKQMVSSLSLQ